MSMNWYDCAGRRERIALGELTNRLPDWLHKTAADGEGHLDAIVEMALIEQLGPGHSAFHKDAVAARMAIMRDELAPCGSSPLEVLLAERAALCWLHVQLMEYEAIAYRGRPGQHQRFDQSPRNEPTHKKWSTIGLAHAQVSIRSGPDRAGQGPQADHAGYHRPDERVRERSELWQPGDRTIGLRIRRNQRTGATESPFGSSGPDCPSRSRPPSRRWRMRCRPSSWTLSGSGPMPRSSDGRIATWTLGAGSFGAGSLHGRSGPGVLGPGRGGAFPGMLSRLGTHYAMERVRRPLIESTVA